MKNIKRIKNSCFYFFLLISQVIYSQVNFNKTAQSTMNFLLVATSAKASAMGEAFGTIGLGTEGMFFNPAGLSQINNNFEVNINYSKWIADINYISGAVAWNLNNYGVVGINLLTVDYGVINGTTWVPPGMEDVYRNGYVDVGPVSNVAAYAVGVSYAKSISKEFAVGGTMKVAGQNLGENHFYNGINKENNAIKLVFDAGIKYITGFRSFMFGMSIRNFSSNIRRELVDEQLPLIFSLGGAMNLLEVINLTAPDDNQLNLAIDFLHQNNYSERVNLGLEYKFLNMLSLRGGYQTNRDLASWSGGVGFNSSFDNYDFELNYSYSKFEIFDSVNRISLIFSF